MSNLALQIREEKERRAENAENLELQAIPTRTVHAHGTVHLALFHPAARFAYCLFWFLPNLSLVMDFHFGFFFNFPYTEHLFKPQSSFVKHLINNKVTGEAFSFPASSPFSHFLLFSFSFSRHPNILRG